MTLEQNIHYFLVHSCGGYQKNIKGISQTQLSKMKQGSSGISTKKLAEVLKANELTGNIVLQGEKSQTTIKLF